MVEQDCPGGSEIHALALSVEQAVAEPMLHPLDHPAERWLGEVDQRSGTTEAAGFSDGEKSPKLAFVEIHTLSVCHLAKNAIVAMEKTGHSAARSLPRGSLAGRDHA
jgi:hypothetical protein